MGKLEPELQMSGVTFHVGVWTLEEKVGQKRGGRDETHMVPGSDKEHLVSTEASVQRVGVK